jgi:hypothetical protein
VRQTRYLPHRPAANLSRSITFAAEIGRPLNAFVTINYGLTFCTEEAMTRAFRRLLKSFYGKWFTRHPKHRSAADRAATYAWVAEGKGGHHGVHWLVYIPAGLRAEFERELRRWLEKTAGPIIDEKAIDVRPANRPQGAGEYMLKGLTEAHARRYKIKAEFQGVVFGKRCGISENLGPAAIKRHRAAIAASAPRLAG